jgi:hypothetical protein
LITALNGSERFQLVNALFNTNISINATYPLSTIKMIINDATGKIGKLNNEVNNIH